MNKIIIFIFSLIASSIAFAEIEPNLCDINLTKVANYRAEYAITTGEPEKSELKALHEKAEQYQKQGDIKNCIAATEQALSIIARHANN